MKGESSLRIREEREERAYMYRAKLDKNNNGQKCWGAQREREGGDRKSVV